ncbi:hypothetical protein J3T92_06625, partial [Bifidobacterium sp. B4081]|nr:hypothetical protein [Bifidobacterium sp. B4077]MCX8646279.1 hypothetical protein [Bifidobacterium sp. B4081]
MSRSVIAVLVTLLAALAMVVPLGLSALSAGQANAVDGQDGTASRKPLLYKMLAYNQRIDSSIDELRMDFILRVKHNEFDPSCAKANGGIDTTGSCNLSFIYPYEGSTNPPHYRRIKYLNTIASKSSTDPAWTGAYNWAKNQDQFFTVHKIINSGLYDYLTISVEGDLNLGDTGDSSAHKTGGVDEPLNIYAIVGQQIGALGCGGDTWSWTSNIAADECYYFYSDINIKAPDRTSNITSALTAEGRGFKKYMKDCLGSGADLQCSGPWSYVGWDNNPNLYSGGQPNWGMVTDYGFPASNGINGTAPGGAPPRSFFVYWLNVRGGTDVCSQTNSYYYQWVALKDGQWVPVDELTPGPVLVTGQQPSPNTLTDSGGATSSVNSYSAFNLPKQQNNPNELFATDKDGNPMPAQNSDGSINFG